MSLDGGPTIRAKENVQIPVELRQTISNKLLTATTHITTIIDEIGKLSEPQRVALMELQKVITSIGNMPELQLPVTASQGPRTEDIIPRQNETSEERERRVHAEILRRLDEIDTAWQECQGSFAHRSDLVEAYKLSNIPERLRKNLENPNVSIDYKLDPLFSNGVAHDTLRAGLDLRSYPSEDPNWIKISGAVQKADELVRYIVSSLGFTINTPKLFEAPDRTVDPEYMATRAFTLIPEIREKVWSVVKDKEAAGEDVFGRIIVTVTRFGVLKDGQPFNRTAGILFARGEWR